MKLEQQVISLELAKRLKELGVKQESIYAWCDCDIDGTYHLVAYNNADKGKRFAAFTVAELGEMLPFYVDRGGVFFYLTFEKSRDVWHISYEDMNSNGLDEDTEKDVSEAEVRGLMLAYLIENNLLSV